MIIDLMLVSLVDRNGSLAANPIRLFFSLYRAQHYHLLRQSKVTNNNNSCNLNKREKTDWVSIASRSYLLFHNGVSIFPG